MTFSTNTEHDGGRHSVQLRPERHEHQRSGNRPVRHLLDHPAGPLTLNTPTVGQVYAGPATLTWNAVTGATKYYVFIYDQYPTVAGNPTPVVAIGTPLAAGTTSTTTTLPSGKDYYAVVVGAADQTQLPGQTPVTNAAMTFSQITRFHVQ